MSANKIKHMLGITARLPELRLPMIIFHKVYFSIFYKSWRIIVILIFPLWYQTDTLWHLQNIKWQKLQIKVKTPLV